MPSSLGISNWRLQRLGIMPYPDAGSAAKDRISIFSFWRPGIRRRSSWEELAKGEASIEAVPGNNSNRRQFLRQESLVYHPSFGIRRSIPQRGQYLAPDNVHTFTP